MTQPAPPAPVAGTPARPHHAQDEALPTARRAPAARPGPRARSRKGRSKRFDARFSKGYATRVRRIGPVLLPRETGAIAQILVVLVATLVVAGGRLPAVLVAAASLAAFLAHEPFLIVTNLRGPRTRHEHALRAWRQLVVAPVLSVGAAIAGVVLGPEGTGYTLLAPAVPALAVTPLVFGRLEKTLEGELLVAATIAAFGLPIAYAGGLGLRTSAAIASVWGVSLCIATLGVRRVTAKATDSTTVLKSVGPLVAAALAMGALVSLAQLEVLPGFTPLAPLPMLAFSLWLLVRPPHMRHIKKVGWTLAGCLTATAGLLVWGAG